MLRAGQKIVELESSLNGVRTVVEDTVANINGKVDTMKAFVQDVEGRFTQLERALPERMHKIEERQEYVVVLINGITTSITEKIKEIERVIQDRPTPPVPPSFGGPRTEHFNVGSPLSAPTARATLNPEPTQETNVPVFDPWAQATRNNNAGPQAPNPNHVAWDARAWDVSSMKSSKELKPFNGSDAAYRTWAMRVKDHFSEKNPDWLTIFSEIEKQKEPIIRDALRTGVLNGNGYTFDVDFRWIANALWTFIGKHLVDSIYSNRSILSGGGNNGLELWRSLFIKHEGGADQVELGGMGSLHSFPQCDKVENLQLWVGKWQEMKDLYGAGISDTHLKTMFINILPPLVQKEVRERPGIVTLQQCINHVLSDIGRLNDLKLSKIHSDKLKQSLSATQRMSPLTEKIDDADEVEPAPEGDFKSLINILSDKMDHIAAAMNRPKRADPKAQAQPKRGESDFKKFGNRCLHCGSEEHRAVNCPVKKALMAKNGGKLPQGYKSAFDKWKAKQPKSVSPIIDDDMYSDDDEEFSETASVRPLWSVPMCGICTDQDFAHVNSFAGLFDEDHMDEDEDDEAAMVNALNHISSRVTIGPKPSQKAGKKNGTIKPLDRSTIASIAKQVREGKFALPDLDLHSNAEYEAIWALVDSGAARSCARRQEHFGNTHTQLKPSSVRMATANGEELKSRGCFKLKAYSAEGNLISQTFEDADVDMPIMSVVELSENGALGTDVVFRKKDGAMVDVQSNSTSKFVRRKGVYFMKLFVPRNKAANPDFIRPGCA